MPASDTPARSFSFASPRVRRALPVLAFLSFLPPAGRLWLIYANQWSHFRADICASMLAVNCVVLFLPAVVGLRSEGRGARRMGLIAAICAMINNVTLLGVTMSIDDQPVFTRFGWH